MPYSIQPNMFCFVSSPEYSNKPFCFQINNIYNIFFQLGFFRSLFYNPDVVFVACADPSSLCSQLFWTCQCSPVLQRCWGSAKLPTPHTPAYLSDSTSSPDEPQTTPQPTDPCLHPLTESQVSTLLTFKEAS